MTMGFLRPSVNFILVLVLNWLGKLNSQHQVLFVTNLALVPSHPPFLRLPPLARLSPSAAALIVLKALAMTSFPQLFHAMLRLR